LADHCKNRTEDLHTVGGGYWWPMLALACHKRAAHINV
jgi:hypothetical protein